MILTDLRLIDGTKRAYPRHKSQKVKHFSEVTRRVTHSYYLYRSQPAGGPLFSVKLTGYFKHQIASGLPEEHCDTPSMSMDVDQPVPLPSIHSQPALATILCCNCS